MTQSNDDIAWMRQLAEEGRQAPFGGGSILLAAGVVYGLASLVHWSVISGLIGGDPRSMSVVWGVATAVFLVLLVVLSIGRGARTSVVTASNRAMGAAWSAVGWGIFAMIASLGVIAWRLGAEQGLMVVAVIPSAVLVFYGLGWAVSAAMNRSRFMAGLAAASLIAAPIVAALTSHSAQYLAYGLALFALMAVPGAVLMRQAAQSTRARAGHG